MQLQKLSAQYLPMIEDHLRSVVSNTNIDGDRSLEEMISYHMGWAGPGAGEKAQGKRIRPLLLLLVNEAVGGTAQDALPAAAAVEILHNFSLVHDDIEDNSSTRRGRKTLWELHGVSLAINAGDSMFTLSYQALDGLQNYYPPDTCLRIYHLFSEACLALTKGQHLDISFENSHEVQVDEYLQMIQGKTAALLAASAEIGAVLGGASPETQQIYKDLGKFTGLAFQVYDDYLGIWGDAAVMGKSTSSDLIARKKSLPILYGLAQDNQFARMWTEEITDANAEQLAAVLKTEGAYDYTKFKADEYTRFALDALEAAAPSGPAGEALAELIYSLIKRQF